MKRNCVFFQLVIWCEKPARSYVKLQLANVYLELWISWLFELCLDELQIFEHFLTASNGEEFQLSTSWWLVFGLGLFLGCFSKNHLPLCFLICTLHVFPEKGNEFWHPSSFVLLFWDIVNYKINLCFFGNISKHMDSYCNSKCQADSNLDFARSGFLSCSSSKWEKTIPKAWLISWRIRLSTCLSCSVVFRRWNNTPP